MPVEVPLPGPACGVMAPAAAPDPGIGASVSVVRRRRPGVMSGAGRGARRATAGGVTAETGATAARSVVGRGPGTVGAMAPAEVQHGVGDRALRPSAAPATGPREATADVRTTAPAAAARRATVRPAPEGTGRRRSGVAPGRDGVRSPTVGRQRVTIAGRADPVDGPTGPVRPVPVGTADRTDMRGAGARRAATAHGATTGRGRRHHVRTGRGTTGRVMTGRGTTAHATSAPGMTGRGTTGRVTTAGRVMTARATTAREGLGRVTIALMTSVLGGIAPGTTGPSTAALVRTVRGRSGRGTTGRQAPVTSGGPGATTTVQQAVPAGVRRPQATRAVAVDGTRTIARSDRVPAGVRPGPTPAQARRVPGGTTTARRPVTAGATGHRPVAGRAGGARRGTVRGSPRTPGRRPYRNRR